MGLYDPDEAFVMRFSEYMNRCSLPYLVLAFTEISAVEDYLQRQTLSLLVTSEQASFDYLDIPTIILSETKQNKENVLYRYQSADKMVKKITMYFMGLIPATDTQSARIYMVYSPLGRCGKTSLALELVRQLSGSLYIGLESFSSLDVDAGSLEPLLYSIMQKEASVIEEFSDLQGGLYNSYVLKSPDCYFDLRSLDYEHFSWFLSLLRTSERYTSIVLDIGAAVFDDLRLLLLCDRLLVPTVPGEREAQILESMERGLQKNNCKEVLTKMELLALPDKSLGSDRFEAYVQELLD